MNIHIQASFVKVAETRFNILNFIFSSFLFIFLVSGTQNYPTSDDDQKYGYSKMIKFHH